MDFSASTGPPPMHKVAGYRDPKGAGIKARMRYAEPRFDEQALGYERFLPFVRAAEAQGRVLVDW